MSRKNNLLLAGLLVIALAFAFALPTISAQAGSLQQETTTSVVRKLTVTGTGQVTAPPDMAVIRLGVTTTAETAAKAVTDNNAAMQTLLKTLSDEGIADADIQTAAFRLFPRYGEQPLDTSSVPPIAGYDVTNVVEIKVRDLEGLGDLLDSAVQAGSNTVESIALQISDSDTMLDQAREAAMQDARNKAEKLADLAEGDLGMVLEILEIMPTPGIIQGRDMALQESLAVSIEPGTQSVQVQLTVVWELQ